MKVETAKQTPLRGMLLPGRGYERGLRRRARGGGSHCVRANQRGTAMADNNNRDDREETFWYSGRTTRRRVVGWSAKAAGALGAMMLVPAPWRAAFGAEKPYKIGSLQPLTGGAAVGGKTALVGIQMAVDRINKSGGINGRPVELTVEDDESKP